MKKLELFAVLLFVISAVSCSKGGGGGDKTSIDVPTELSSRKFDNGNVELTWGGSSMATGYEVEVIPDGGIGDVSTSTLPKHLILKKDLDYSTTYQWRVRVKVGNDYGDWSDYEVFTTRTKPPAEDFLGVWQAEPENVTAKATFLGREANVSDVMPSQVVEQADPIQFTISEVVEDGQIVDNKVYLDLVNISSYIPVDAFERFTLSVRQDHSLYGQTSPQQEFVRNFNPPLTLSELPGMTEALADLAEGGGGVGGFDLSGLDLTNLSIESIIYTVHSVIITGITDPADLSKLRITIDIDGEINIKATDPMFDFLISFAKLASPDLMSMPITLEADLDKVE